MTARNSIVQRTLDYTIYLLLRVVLCILQTLDLETCDYLCRVLGHAIADFTPLRRQVTNKNLKLVFGDLREDQLRWWRRRMWHHLLLMICEIAHAPRKLRRTNWRRHFVLRNQTNLVRAVLEDHPTLLATGHFGHFEISGYMLGVFGIPVASIARPLDNPVVDQFLREFRCSGGQKIFPKSGSSELVEAHLRDRGKLAILADQFAGPKGVWIEFFGHPTSCHKAISLFVLSAGAAMAVTYNRRLRRPMQFELGCIDVVDPSGTLGKSLSPELQSVEGLTEWYNRCLEKAIRLAPEQYWWLHARWREIPPTARKRLERRKARKCADNERRNGERERSSEAA